MADKENELLIKINADAKNAVKAFEDVQSKTEDLQDVLNKTGIASAAAFAALSAEVFTAVKAFGESEQISKQLSLALQNQGIFTTNLKQKYVEYATAVEHATGIDDDAIIKAEAIAQSYLGQKEITEELAFAIADLGAKTGNVSEAAAQIARTIGTTTNAFARQGLELSATATYAERYAKTLDFVRAQAGGFAAESNKGIGSILGLKTAFGNFQEQIGERFAPLIELVVGKLTEMFQLFNKHPIVADFIAAIIAGGLAVSAIGIALPVVTAGITGLEAAMVAAGVAANLALGGIPLLVTGVATALAFITTSGKENVEELNKVLKTSEDALGLSLKAEFREVSANEEKKAQLKRDFEERLTQLQKEFADKKAAIDAQHEQTRIQIAKASLELLKLQNANASKEIIELKQRELEVLKALNEQHTEEEIVQLQIKHERIKELEDEQRAEDKERKAEFEQIQDETEDELNRQRIDHDTELNAERQKVIRDGLYSEAEADRQVQEEILKRRVQARNQELLDRRKYGVAVAELNKFLNSSEVQGVSQATGELVALQNSRNSTLKSIGKAAAITQITIKTAQSAINIYEGFSTIPIIGPTLGLVAAAAAIAYGAEQIGQVNAAAEGGLVEGGIPGRDSVPFLLSPGELVTPAKNFEEVVGAVQTQRSGGSGVNDSEILSVLKNIESKVSGQTTIIQGDVLSDESFIDSLVRKISDAVEFRNAKIVGVNA